MGNKIVAARIDFIFVLSERAKANFPSEAGLPARRGPKAIQGQPTLAIADGPVADDSCSVLAVPFGSVRFA